MCKLITFSSLAHAFWFRQWPHLGDTISLHDSQTDRLASATQSSAPHPSPESPSPAPSSDPFVKRLDDMFGLL